MIAGAVGSAISSDLGARNVREEIDALKVMGINPVQRLVAPRVVAALVVARAAQRDRRDDRDDHRLHHERRQRHDQLRHLPRLVRRLQPAVRPVPRRVQGGGLRVHRHDRRRAQGAARLGRTEGRRRRGQPGGRAQRDPAGLRQRRRSPRPTSCSCRRRSSDGHGASREQPRRRRRRARSALVDGVIDVLAAARLSSRRFSWQSAAPRSRSTMRLYHNEVLRQLTDIAWGSGAIIVGGGTIGVMMLLVRLGRHVARHRGLQRPRAGRPVAADRLHLGERQHPRARPRWSPRSRSAPRSAAGSPRSSAR